jgi:hypothetical protein
MRSALSGALLSCALAACGTSSSGDAPLQTAETITKAIYANDFDATVAPFDDETKKSISRSELGALSDRMHALGDFKSLTQRSGNADTGRYEFDAAFTNGSLVVQMRLDPSGKVGAYRVVPATGAPTPTSTQG